MPHVSTRPRACASPRPLWFAAILLSLLAAAPAVAADWPEDQISPQPLADDLTLPLPCGGAMAFRKVLIPSEGPLSDRLIAVGGTNDERGYAESTRPAHIAGGFSDGDGRYYLIGRYEVTQLQYQAVKGECPEVSPDGRLPQTKISWVDAVLFAERWNLWLRKEAPDALPKEDDELGFVRLPTEVEWEFAARGGIHVSESEFQEAVFPVPEGLGRYVWYGGADSSNNEVQRIGLLQPNPLGLHDVLGNVDEIVFEPFRLNKLDRLHGQAGGFIVRGGNFSTAEEDVRTAYRHEVPFYRGKDPRRSATTGFRVAVVAPVITSRARIEQIENAWWELGDAAPEETSGPLAGTQLGDERADPIEELGVIAEASGDEAVEARLKKLQLAFRASYQARDEERGRAAKARLRLGTFLCQKLKDDHQAIAGLEFAHEKCVEVRSADHERCQRQVQRIEQEENAEWQNLRYYADTIVGLVTDYGEATLGQQLETLKSELTARGVPHLRPFADRYVEQVERYREKKVIERGALLETCKGV